MNSLENTSALDVQVQQPLTDIQQTVNTRLTETTVKVVKEVIQTIVNSSSMSAQTFVETQITPRQAPLSEIDERTGMFFQKMMGAINEEINKVPSLSQSFMIFAMFTGDQQIRKKLVEGIALPHIKNLIINLDEIKTSIVDDIIKS